VFEGLTQTIHCGRIRKPLPEPLMQPVCQGIYLTASARPFPKHRSTPREQTAGDGAGFGEALISGTGTGSLSNPISQNERKPLKGDGGEMKRWRSQQDKNMNPTEQKPTLLDGCGHPENTSSASIPLNYGTFQLSSWRYDSTQHRSTPAYKLRRNAKRIEVIDLVA
jgi:hypothetical protein